MSLQNKKALTVSTACHLVLVLVIFQTGRTRSQVRSYPQIVTARLIQKSAAPVKTPAKVETPAPRPITKPEARKLPQQELPKPKESKKPALTQTPDPVPSKEAAKPAASQQDNATTPGSTSSIRLDAPDFQFPHYLALLQFRIENQWRPPFSGKGQFLATVHFVIARSGKVLSVELEKSSGTFTFDQAALRAVHESNPLPALPAGANLETLGVHFDFVANW